MSYFKELDQKTFDEYLKGIIAKKSNGFRDAKEEFQHLKNHFKSHAVKQGTSLMWDKLKFEIEFFKNKCKFENL